VKWVLRKEEAGMNDKDGKNENKMDSRRRFFLGAATAGPALAVAALAVGRKEAVEVAAPVVAKPVVESGYHETEHIRNYYSTARYL
jgi:hypothetical protein